MYVLDIIHQLFLFGNLSIIDEPHVHMCHGAMDGDPPPKKKQICKIKKMWSFDMMNNSIGAHFVIDFPLVHVP